MLGPVASGHFDCIFLSRPLGRQGHHDSSTMIRSNGGHPYAARKTSWIHKDTFGPFGVPEDPTWVGPWPHDGFERLFMKNHWNQWKFIEIWRKLVPIDLFSHFWMFFGPQNRNKQEVTAHLIPKMQQRYLHAKDYLEGRMLVEFRYFRRTFQPGWEFPTWRKFRRKTSLRRLTTFSEWVKISCGHFGSRQANFV